MITLTSPQFLSLPLSFRIPISSPQSSPHHLPSTEHPLWRKGSSPTSAAVAIPQFVATLPKSRCRASISGAERNARQDEDEDEDEEAVGYGDEVLRESEDLGAEGEAFQKTLMLVECSMFASVAGLAYFLSNSLAIENYFGCFFSLPIVISSMRWGLAAGRKTMAATAMLLLTLSGPVKASTYLLMHGLVGLTMGSLWRLRINWGFSIVLCTFVRAMGAIGYVLISSFLIRENILALITINVHASLSYILMAIGVNTIPSMDIIYAIFGTLLLLNCGFFVLLLHILYAVFLTKLGMKASLSLPRWLAKAI